MKLIRPYFEILTTDEEFLSMLKNIERARRTCYKSEDKITNESAPKFVEMIINHGHESVLEHEKITVKFICDRGVSHELVRHRIASFSQESTRYCNYTRNKFNSEITFIIPEWIDLTNWDGRIHASAIDTRMIWLRAMHRFELDYNKLIEDGWQPQQARSVLPNSLKTEIVITANLREWREIFRQRTSRASHPQMRELMIPLLNQLKNKLQIIFDDI